MKWCFDDGIVLYDTGEVVFEEPAENSLTTVPSRVKEPPLPVPRVVLDEQTGEKRLETNEGPLLPPTVVDNGGSRDDDPLNLPPSVVMLDG